jgi:hypothetical protein
MRTETINCKDRRTAAKHCGWASKIVKVEGGFKVFESWQDYQTWINQK